VDKDGPQCKWPKVVRLLRSSPLGPMALPFEGSGPSFLLWALKPLLQWKRMLSVGPAVRYAVRNASYSLFSIVLRAP